MRPFCCIAVLALLVASCVSGEAASPSTMAADTTTVTQPSRATASTTTAAPTTEQKLQPAAEPGTVFSWRTDDLTEWITEDEMTALLEELQERYGYYGGDLGGEAVLSHPGGDLVWGVGQWSIAVHAGLGYHTTPTETDPRLPPGVTYVGESVSYSFSGPNSKEAICITLTTPGTTNGIEGERFYMSIFFRIATMMLKEMGWSD